MIETILCGVATLVVFWKLLGVVASLNIHAFDGHPWQFIGLTCHWALVGAGSLATLLGLSIGGALLVIGLAMMILSDRRSR